MNYMMHTRFSHCLLAAAVLIAALAGCTSEEAQNTAAIKQPPAAIEIVDTPFAQSQPETEKASESSMTIPSYQPRGGLAGSLSSIGSDTMANVMTLWTEEFKRFHPGVNLQVQAAGSSTAPPALTEGTSDLGPMSRAMKDKEIEAFEQRHGYKPTAIKVAIDALAVYVHKDNPLSELSIAQVDSIFSATRRCGLQTPATHWGDLGLEGSWNERPIQLYGRNSVSGTYGYFKKVGLCSGDFRNNVNEQPGSASVVQAVASSLNGIGYSGIGYVTSGVKTLALAEGNRPAVSATPYNAASGDYPLARYLYLYVNKKPGQPSEGITRSFIEMVLSEQGQEIVAKDGYIPLPANLLRRELSRAID